MIDSTARTTTGSNIKWGLLTGCGMKGGRGWEGKSISVSNNDIKSNLRLVIQLYLLLTCFLNSFSSKSLKGSSAPGHIPGVLVIFHSSSRDCWQASIRYDLGRFDCCWVSSRHAHLMSSAAFTCVKGSTIQLVLCELLLRIKLWILE